MATIFQMKNSVQNYAWGDTVSLPALLGKAPDGQPQAELWMGAHPKASSLVRVDGSWLPLRELIAREPEKMLGQQVIHNFGKELPYLFKVLAAGAPLSIQAHPDQQQAVAGFEREDRLGIALNAPQRNYRDPSHKPECILALTAFWGLNGFRTPQEIYRLFQELELDDLKPELDLLGNGNAAKSVKHFFQALLRMGTARKAALLGAALKKAEKMTHRDPAYDWMPRLHAYYPKDIGVFAPLMLNLVQLKPGQAMYLDARTLHAYLDGTGMEIMANSDNVLRGGLTAKHVDIPELMQVLEFAPRAVQLVESIQTGAETRYPCPAAEFILSKIELDAGAAYQVDKDHGGEIIFCTEGKGALEASQHPRRRKVNRGDAFFIAAAAGAYRLTGPLSLYRAAVPLS